MDGALTPSQVVVCATFHLKSACLDCFAKLQTFDGGGRPTSKHHSRGTALSISTSAYHFNLVDPEE